MTKPLFLRIVKSEDDTDHHTDRSPASYIFSKVRIGADDFAVVRDRLPSVNFVPIWRLGLAIISFSRGGEKTACRGLRIYPILVNKIDRTRAILPYVGHEWIANELELPAVPGRLRTIRQAATWLHIPRGKNLAGKGAHRRTWNLDLPTSIRSLVDGYVVIPTKAAIDIQGISDGAFVYLCWIYWLLDQQLRNKIQEAINAGLPAKLDNRENIIPLAKSLKLTALEDAERKAFPWAYTDKNGRPSRPRRLRTFRQELVDAGYVVITKTLLKVAVNI